MQVCAQSLSYTDSLVSILIFVCRSEQQQQGEGEEVGTATEPPHLSLPTIPIQVPFYCTLPQSFLRIALMM